MELLTNNYADPMAMDDDQKTAMEIAILNVQEEVVNFIAEITRLDQLQVQYIHCSMLNQKSSATTNFSP